MTHCPSPKTLQLRSLGEGQIHQYCPNHFKSKTEVGFVAALRWIFDQPLLLYRAGARVVHFASFKSVLIAANHVVLPCALYWSILILVCYARFRIPIG